MESFHLARQAGDADKAIFFLEKALYTAEYRAEALIWKGIDAMQAKAFHQAFLNLGSAAVALPKRSDVQALTGRVILMQGKPALAEQMLTAAWKHNPADSALRSMRWHARSQTLSAARLRKLILALLPEINDPQELQLVVGLLARQADAPRYLGVCRYDADSSEVSGWAIELGATQTPVSLHVESNEQRYACSAEQADALLTNAGLCTDHGAFRVKINDPATTLHVRFQDGTHLTGSPLSNLPAFVAPRPVSKSAARQEPVNVLVPVYDGLEETLQCVHSVLRSRAFNRTAHRLLVLDDATPDPALRQALADLAAAGEIEHIQQPSNLGFIRNVNRGMLRNPERDVVWLNADTRVHGDWLDRLRAVAYSAKDIASVTPFTNNGELMSFPQSRVSHAMPSVEQHAALDDLARAANSPAIEIETGCGFCLYIKRDAIDQVGYLDEVELLRGYGEETDWCLRARSLGWRHMGAPNIFVAHEGGISFGDEKSLRVAHNNAILKRRYPTASARYQDFCVRDPLKPARQALQRARLSALAEVMAQPPAKRAQKTGLKQLKVQADTTAEAGLTLTWTREGTLTLATLRANVEPFALDLEYRLPMDAERLLLDLRTLPLDEIVYHELSTCPEALLTLHASLDKPYRIVCRDDHLLQPTASSDWSEFAAQASSIQVPWKALRKRYAQLLAQANVVAHAPKLKIVRPGKQPPRVLLIADELHHAAIAEQWIQLGRRITRDKLDITLLIVGDSPWRRLLLATGAVHALPDLPGLERADCITLAGCHGAVSLDSGPGAGWKAPMLASTLGLALYAAAGPLAQEAGALSLQQLPFSLSRT